MTENKPDVGALVGKGNALLLLGRDMDAFECFDIAIEEYPNDPMALISKGDALSVRREHEKAQECYRKAVGVNMGVASSVLVEGFGVGVLGRPDLIWRDRGRMFSALGMLDAAKRCQLKYLEAAEKLPREEPPKKEEKIAQPESSGGGVLLHYSTERGRRLVELLKKRGFSGFSLSKADGEYRILIEAGQREDIRAVLKDGFSTFKAAGFLEKEERAEKELKAAGVLYVRRHDGIYSLVDEPGGELITAPHVFEWIAKTHRGSHIDHMGVHHAIAKLAKRGLLVKQEGGSGASVYELSYDAGKQGKSIDPVELLVLQTICRKSGAHIRGVFDGDVRMEIVKKKAA